MANFWGKKLSQNFTKWSIREIKSLDSVSGEKVLLLNW